MAKLKLQGQGAIITKSAEVTVSALAAAAEEELTISDSDAEVGDVIVCSPSEALDEAGLCIASARVSAAGTIKVRISNQSGSGLTGSTEDLYYAIISDRTV